MAVSYLNTTTLTAAVSATATLLPVTSNTNHTVGQYLVIGGEAVQIQSKAGTTQTFVQRGMLGTRARAHVNAATIFGSISAFGPTQYEPFSGEQRVTLPDVPPNGLPAYPVNLGSRKRDAFGNEYIFVDFLTNVYPGQMVTILPNFTSDALATTGRGPVGVVAEVGACTSDNWGWVQIYGRCLVMLGNAGSSPSDAANGPTTLSTSAATKFQLGTSLSSPNSVGWVSDASTGSGYAIDGMKVALDASVGDVSAVTSGTNGGHTGGQIAVFLNYPEVTYRDQSS